MNLKQAFALIGREVDVRTVDGFVARVQVLDALSAYGRVRLKVAQPAESARATVIDGDRFVRESGPAAGVFVHAADCGGLPHGSADCECSLRPERGA